jgi:hypothetical protein
MYRFFETQAKMSNLTMREQILPLTATLLCRWLADECPGSELSTGYKIVVSSYMTWWQRTLRHDITTDAGKCSFFLPSYRASTWIAG